MPVEQGLSFGFLCLFQLFLRFGAAELHGILIGLCAFGGAGFFFAVFIEIDRCAHGVQ